MPQELDRMIREIVDRQEIADLIHRFAQAVDRWDAKLFASLFTPDAVLHHGVYDGPAANLLVGTRAGPYLLTHHQIGNIRIALKGDEATAVSYLNALHRARHDDRIVDETVLARYLDKVVRYQGNWRFAERTLVFDWSNIAPADERAWWDSFDNPVLTGKDGEEDPSIRFVE